MIKIKIKPLSINESFQGRRYKTAKCKAFEKELWYLLPNDYYVPRGKLEIRYEFGLSSKNADLLNPEKILTDLLSRKYSFDDKYIYRMTLERKDIPKGEEYVAFNIKKIK